MTDVNSFIGEEDVWATIDPDDMWIMDKLILSKKMGYNCGPVGTPVPERGWYIVRPCVNALGLGLGTEKVFIEDSTDWLPTGHFWCEIFEGRHLSIDYHYGLPDLVVEGFRSPTSYTKWDKWVKVDDTPFHFPDILDSIIEKPWVNCEFIGNKLIEVHFRRNADFQWDNKEFIPVWDEPNLGDHLERQYAGYRYVEYPEIHGRIGAFIK